MPETNAPPAQDDDAAPAREELHFRRIDMRGYKRSDGLYEIEGRMTDRKPHAFVPISGDKLVPAHQPLHDMGVRLVFDEHMVVHEVATFMDAKPYDACSGADRALQAMKGVKIASGWSREVRERLGGASSCAHLRELLIPLATAAFQSLSTLRAQQPVRLDRSGRPAKIDSCYAYGAQREVVRQLWPEFHRPEAPDK